MVDTVPKIPPSGFKPMADAPTDRVILLQVWSGKTFPVKWQDGFLDSDECACGGWVAQEEGNHPPCWDDGACWESNSDGMPSDPPIGWKEMA